MAAGRRLRAGAGITGKQHPTLSTGLQHEATPKRSIAIEERAGGKMSGRRCRDAQALNHDILPLIQLNRPDPMSGQDPGVAKQGHNARFVATLDLA